MLLHLPDHYTAVIVGCGGIGQALLSLLAEQPRLGRLIAVTRNKDDLHSLCDGIAKNGIELEIVEANVTTDDGLQRLKQHLEHAPVHLLFNTIGVLHEGQKDQQMRMAPEKRLEALSFEALDHTFHINAATPAMLIAALADNLSRHPAIITSLSARVGSIGDNSLGGWYAYRASKAAHNMLMKTAAIELARRNRQSIVLCLHPGTTDTALSRPFQNKVPKGKLFTPARVAEHLMAVISQRTPEDTGNFYDWNDQPIAW